MVIDRASGSPSPPDPGPRIVALVLTYNSAHEAPACVESLMRSSLPGLELRVIDNASSDDTVALLQARFGELDLTVAPSNLGFAAGCNLGLRAALDDGVEYVLLVNPDTAIAADAVDRLVEFMDKHPHAGAVGPKTLSTTPMPGGEPRLLYAGAFHGRLPLRQSVPGIGRADTSAPAPALEVDYIWGHGMLLRLSALVTVGLFDERFFMYNEDLDLCRRLSSAGFELWCEPAACMWHAAPDGARAIDSEAWRWALKADSMALFHAKHYGPVLGRLLSFVTVLAEAGQLLRQGHLRAFGHQLRGSLACLVRRRPRKSSSARG